MSETLEYRVRPVTRFIVTEYDSLAKVSTVIAEVDGGGTADRIAEVFAQKAMPRPGVTVITDKIGSADECAPKHRLWVPTLLELAYGSDHEQEQRRYFRYDQEPDALVRMAEAILQRDGDPKISAAYAFLKRLPDTIFPEGQPIAGWTKTSDERPTAEGALSPELVA